MCAQHVSFLNLKEISVEEVASHNFLTDAWIAVNGHVCDVTDFLGLHPGGDSVMLPLLGTDATAEFKEMNHSVEAEKMVASLAIGRLKSTQSGGAPFRDGLSIRNSNPTSRLKPADSSDSVAPIFSSGSSVIDVSKPLIPQVYRLSHSDYCQLVQEKVLRSDPCRMFTNGLFEALSRTQWFVIPGVWLPVSCYSMYLGVSSSSSYHLPSLLSFPLLWLLGAFLWTFFEYIFHRFIFHYAEKHLPDHGAAYVIHFTAHSIHHVFPMDHLRLVMPPALFMILATPVFILSKYIFRIPPHILYALWSGGVCCYVAYDMIHYTSHFSSFSKIPHLLEMKQYHMKHHFKDSSLGYGVSSKFWDFVFGTQL